MLMRFYKIVLTSILFGLILNSGCIPSLPVENGGVIQTETPILPTVTPSESDEDFDEAIEESPAVNGGLITMWHPFSGRDAEIIDTLVDTYNNNSDEGFEVVSVSHADVDVLIEDIEGVSGTENEPDLIIAPSHFLRFLNSQSRLAIIDSDQESAIANENENTNYFPAFWNLDIDADQRYGVPYLQTGNFLFFNGRWAQDVGYSELPATPEAFSEQACMAYNQNRFDSISENDGTGGYFFPTDPVSILSWLETFNGGIDFNTRGEVVITTPENNTAIAYLFGLYADDCAWWTQKEKRPYQYFENRNTLVYSGTSEEMILQESLVDADETSSLTLIPYPSIAGKPIVYFDSFSFGIMDNRHENQDGMISFIAWMLQPDQHLDMVYQTAAFPLSAREIQQVESSWDVYPVWQQILQYIPFLESVPNHANWYYVEKILDDLGWQIIQYAVTSADLPEYLTQAETIANEMILKNPRE